MKQITEALAWLVVLLVVIVIATALMKPMVGGFLQGLITDKAELERAKGERAIMEASARAVRADTNQTWYLIYALSVLLLLQGLGIGFTLWVLVVAPRQSAYREKDIWQVMD